jgi:hypothetical protein
MVRRSFSLLSLPENPSDQTMSATIYGTKGNMTTKSKKEILAELKKRTDRMKRPNPTKLKLLNGEHHELDGAFVTVKYAVF